MANNKYTIALNENRQENVDFINEYNIRSNKQKSILLQLRTEDFCHTLQNKKIGFECEALVHGPVYRDIYFRYRDYRFDPIEGNDEFDDSVFSSSEKAILDSVIKNVCCYSGKVLEKFTHSEAPWLSTRGELSETVGSDRIIQKEQIGDYFRAVKEKYNMINPNEIKGYTQTMFEQM